MAILDKAARAKADALIAQGIGAEEAGRVADACALYREALVAAPGYAKAEVNLGIALEALGDATGAIACHERALARDPAEPYANYNLGKLHYLRGDAGQAEQFLLRAIESRERFREAQVLLGCARLSQGRAEQALAPFEAALADERRDFNALYHYAQALRTINRLPQARAALGEALALDPANIDARAALADVLLALGDSRAAMAALRMVVEARPDWADALYNYGVLLKKHQELELAEDALRRALAASPAHARAAQMLGGVLLAQGRTAEALALYAAAKQRCPDDFALESAELFALLGHDGIAEEALFARHVSFGRRLEAACAPLPDPLDRPRDARRRLRLGYLSGDFCFHVISAAMLPLLERHDRAAYEIYCYSTGQAPDDYTRRLAARADHWRACHGLSADAIARAIADDRIDILVDLAGHSGDPQLAVMARRPAPVQATWIGYLYTTGLTRIDYRITDAVADAPGLTERYHTEALVRLPHAQWCWRPFVSPAQAASPPCMANGHITFGSFHGAMKLSASVRRLWAEILGALPDARLVVLGVPEGRPQEGLLRDLGVARERVTVVSYVSLEDYYRWYDAIDIALDTTPYSGANTTCDALYMGVPVLTAPGKRPASRSAASVLTSVGLTQWIARSPQDFVQRALAFAQQKPLLSELRGSLRARLRASPVMDEPGFVRDLESAYRRMWQQWCAGQPRQGW